MYFYTYTLILPKMNLQKAEYLKKKKIIQGRRILQ